MRSKSSPTLTRRALIRGVASIGGLGAAYAALSAFDLIGHGASARGTSNTEALPNGSLTGKSVVVIGAGLTGLCSGLRLARAGAKVKILEASDRIGGRSLTLRHGDSYRERGWNSDTVMKFEEVGDVAPEDPDNYFNAGPGRIPQHHARVLDYCKELGVELQPFVYMDKANLMQNDAWNGGRPVQARRLKNDLRGHLAELMAKISDQGALDQLISPADMEAFLQMLKHFGQLTGEGAQMVYAGAALKSDYIRAGYRVEMGDITQAGEPWPTLSLDEVLGSDFWRSEMFNDLEYFWQTSLLEAKDGMDMIWKAFLPAKVGSGIADTVENLISVKQPVVAIDLTEQGVNVTTVSGDRHAADYVVVTIPPDLVAKIGGNFLPDRTRATFAAVQIAPACKVGLQAKSRFWEQEDRMYGGISWTKHIISQIWYPNYSFNSPTGVLTAAYNNSQPAAEFGTLNRQARIAETLAGGERLHPGYTDKVFHTNAASIAWQNMPYQSGGWANDTAFSQPEIFSEMVTASHIKERVFMAGDWFSYWPGWQEGALDSAHLASDQIARAALRSR